MNKKIKNATALYIEGIQDGNIKQAVTQYTGRRYTQHSTGVKNGIEGFVDFFTPFIQCYQKRDIDILFAIADSQYVFLQVAQSLNEGEARWLTSDLFDTDNNDKIIEHWDVISEIKQLDNVSKITGNTELCCHTITEHNKDIVRNFICDVMVLGQKDLLDNYINPLELITHHSSDTNAFYNYIGDFHELFKIIGQGEFVVTYCRIERAQQGFARFDIFRLQDNYIKEIWSNQEIIPKKEEWKNSGKF